MKSKIINFELLHLNEHTYNSEQLAATRHRLVMADIQQAAAEGCDTIYGLLLLDGFLYTKQEFIDQIIQIKIQAEVLGINRIILISGMCEKMNNLPVESVFFNYTHRIVYNSYKANNALGATWNSNSSKFLFLGGVPSRANRIQLLKLLYDQNLLSSAVWSFFRPWTDDDKQWCRAAVSCSDAEYEKFLDDCDRAVDSKYLDAKNYSKLTGAEFKEQDMSKQEWIKDPSWIDPAIFNTTLFSIVSEGNAYAPATDLKFLTEKTWRAIANGHPFIFAGYPEQFQYAKSMGLKTFEEYMLIKDYAMIADETVRLAAIVTNVEYFLKHFKDNSVRIHADVMHNHQVIIDIANTQDEFFKTLQLSDTDINMWFGQSGFDHLIRIPNAD